jgi:hypothetical protein
VINRSLLTLTFLYRVTHAHVAQIRCLSAVNVVAGCRNVCFVYVRGEHSVFINIVFVLSKLLYLKVISFFMETICDPDAGV